MSSSWRPFALALGANLGDRAGAIAAAVEALSAHPEVRELRLSSLYETDPVGGPEQPDYLNAVLVGLTRLSPEALLAQARAIEQAHGRQRDIPWGPRTLDLDLLVLGDETRASEELTLPHPRAHERWFVLAPWVEVAPDMVLPGRGKVSELAQAWSGDRDSVRRAGVGRPS